MKKLLLIIPLLTISLALSFCVKKPLTKTNEILYQNPKDTTTNYYIVFKPQIQTKGLLIILPGYGESPEMATQETTIQNEANKLGLLTVFASLQHGSGSFYIDTLSQGKLDTLILTLQNKYQLRDKPLYLGGFSLGGSGVVKYAERAYASKVLPKPKAIFAIDPPLDFERFYRSSEYIIRISKSKIATEESRYFLERLRYEYQGSPVENPKAYHQISPYSYSDTLQTAIKPLLNCPIMLFSEPDIAWQMKERNRSLYELNTTDCTAMINTLNSWGNKNAHLMLTSDKGYRKSTGNKNPHSWSIAEADLVVSWLMSF
jgi:Alpha/beta hydrolase of unknown function (DUF915)